MRSYILGCFLSVASLVLCSCSTLYTPTKTVPVPTTKQVDLNKATKTPDYSARMPKTIKSLGEKVVMVDPNVHAWGAYDAQGNLIKGGLATAGGNWCPDIKRRCHTKSGSFRINSLGAASCKSTLYPRPKGGAPMPYCMFFNGNQGLHGSYNVVDGNASHGCVRLHVKDAEWLRFQFVNIGTKVVVKAY